MTTKLGQRRIVLFLAVLLVVGVGLLVASVLDGSSAHAGTPSSCSTSGGVTSVVVGDSGSATTTTLTKSGANLMLAYNGGAAVSCGAPTSSIQVSLASDATSPNITLKLDETGGWFGCSIPVANASDGNGIGGGLLQILGLSGNNLVAGTSGVNAENCGLAPDITVNYSTLSLTGAGTGVTVSAGGGSTTGSPALRPVTLIGSSSAASTLTAGNGNDTLTGGHTGSTLDFSAVSNTACTTSTSCALGINISGSPTNGIASGAGTLTGPSTPPSYTINVGTDFTTAKGSASIPTTLYVPPADIASTFSLQGNITLQGAAPGAGTPTYTVGTVNAGNTVAAGTGTETFTVLGNNVTVVAGPGNDTFNAGGSGDTFVAGAGQAAFYDPQPGNTVDFSSVGTSSSAQLSINASGVPQTVTGGTAGGALTLNNGQAAVGINLLDTFRNSSTSQSASNFKTFVGATTGSTNLLAGSLGGLTFTGSGSGNSTTLFGNPTAPTGAIVNLSGGVESPTAAISATSSPISGFQLGSGQILVADPGNAPSCAGSTLPAFCDTVVDVTTVTGPSTGYSTFYAGPAPATYTFSDAGDHNTFYGSSGTDNFSSAGNFNDYVPGSGSATFAESTSGQGATNNNTIDFSNVPVGTAAGCSGPPCSLVVNVSGTTTAVVNDQAALVNAAQQTQSSYSFQTGGAAFTNFIGPQGGATTFNGGLGNYTYTGQGAGNSLDFSGVPAAVASTLTFDVTHSPNPQATLGQLPETFSGITNLVGLSGGGTTFVGGATGGYTFKGNGVGNQANFTPQTKSTTLSTTVTGPTSLAGGTVTFSAAGGAQLCSPVPVVIPADGTTPTDGTVVTASCSSSAVTINQQVVAIYTPPTGTTVTGTAAKVFAMSTVPSTQTPTTTQLADVPSAGYTQGQATQLTANVTGTGGQGTVTFSVAGSPSPLCSAAVSDTGAATCLATFPASGPVTLVAIYSSGTSAIAGSEAQQQLMIKSPVIATATAVSGTPSCTVTFNLFAGFSDPCTVVVQVTAADGSSVSQGAVNFTIPGLTGAAATACSNVNPNASGMATCNFTASVSTFQVVAVYTPAAASGPTASSTVTAPISASTIAAAGVTGTTTTLVASPSAIPANPGTNCSAGTVCAYAGTPTTLRATVSTADHGLLPGGTVTFETAAGVALNTALVPSTSPTATVSATATFSTATTADILAVYSPPSSNTVYTGSANQVVLAVSAQNGTTSTETSVRNTGTGVTANLSNSTIAGKTASTAVSVGPGQVLVASPPGNGATCAQTPVPGYCDTLTGITSIVGSKDGSNAFVAGNSSEAFGDAGTAGGDTLDFSNVQTSSTTGLVVNLTGAPVNGTTNSTAASGSSTYNFTNGNADFTTFIGAAGGYTDYLAGATPGLTLKATATAPGNIVDFSADAHPVYANLVTGTVQVTGTGGGPAPTCPASPSQCDTISGLTNIVGSLGGGNGFTGATTGTDTFTGNGNGNTFIGQGATDSFNSTGTGNTFRFGSGSGTITDPTGGNTVSFPAAPSTTTYVNVSGQQVGSTPNNEATAGAATYIFTSFGNAAESFQGASDGATGVGTTFYPGTAADTFAGTGTATNNTLDYRFTTAGGPLILDASTTPTGLAKLGSTNQPFTNIGTFYGLTGGNTTIKAGNTTGLHFIGSGSGNTADFSAATHALTANLPQSTFSLSGVTGTDAISGVNTVLGTAVGGDDFLASTTSETFGASSTATAGEKIDFSAVPTSSSTPLTVNVSGSPVAGTGAGTVANYTAATGATTYTFTTNGADFTTFVGSTGNNAFFAGATPGYNFTGSGGGTDSLSFVNDPTRIDVDLVHNTVTTHGSPAGTDSVTGINNVVGSNAGGGIFTAANSGGDTLTAGGNGNTFNGSTINSTANTYVATGNSNTFNTGQASATITDPGAGNTINFAGVGNSLVVNVSGGQVGGVANNSALGGVSSYTFSNVPTAFDGTSSGGTTFYAGTVPDTYNGQSSTGDVLSFADAASNGPLTICTSAGTSCPAPPATGPYPQQATLGSVKEPFSGIEAFNGLQAGNTTFVGDLSTPVAFTGAGNGNVADFSKAATGVTADLSAGTVTSKATPAVTDPLTGITSVVGSSVGGNTFRAGIGSETFGDRGAAGNDAVDFSLVATSAATPLTVNVSGTSSAGALNDTAAVGSTVYNFTTGGNGFTTFTGANTGYTDFLAPRATVGYSFCAQRTGTACGTTVFPGDTADFSASPTGITANLVSGQVAYGGVTGTDTIGGMATIIGSPSGSNTFDGNLTGTSFNATSPNNTISYAGDSGVPVTLDLSSGKVTAAGHPTDTFAFGPGTTTAVGSSGNDTFILGTGVAALQGDGGTDTVSLAKTPAPGSGTSGDTVDLVHGSIQGPSIGGATFTACNSTNPTTLCLGTITGSPYDDTYAAAAAGPALSITGNGGNDTLDLSAVTAKATVTMPTRSAGGTVAGTAEPISFTGVPNIIGTQPGGDDFIVGTGTESFTENGATEGTVDYSAIGATTTGGVSVSIGNVAGTDTGTGTLANLGISDSFTGINTVIGTKNVDTFKQTSDGSYTFKGLQGSNILDLSGLSADVTVHLMTPVAADTCSSGTNDGTAIGGGVNDAFTCMAQVITAGSQVFQAIPGQAANLNGGGNGTLFLTGDSAGGGTIITLPKGSAPGTVTGDGYNVTFTGMSTVDGTPYNDEFIPGSGNVTINGGGGSDGLNYQSTTGSAAEVNLSSSQYTIPTGFAGAGTTIPADTATGGNGGTITTQGISNVVGTRQLSDLIVGGPGSGSLINAGSGNDRIVPTGGDDYIDGGTGANSVLDLSSLTGQTRLNLGQGAPQATGAGTLTVVPGSIHTVIASNAGSQLQAGNGNNITLQGGPGTDVLTAGTGTQTLNGGGGADTLVAGSGTDTLTGGAQPVTFVPGSGNDTLVGASAGNTLSYKGAPAPVQVNLSSNLFTVPTGKPQAGTSVPGNQASGGWGATVSLAQAQIGSIVGSPLADILATGSTGATITGGGGNDLFVINGGNNNLTATAGSASTFLFEASGNNVISGGGSATVDFSPATVGVTVNLQAGTATGGFGGSQSLAGILNIIGTSATDTLIANAPGGTVQGLGAAINQGDFLEAGPSGGDTLISGGGNSTFCAEAVCAKPGTSTAGGDTMTGGSGNDIFYALNGIADLVSGGGGFDEGYFDSNDNVTNVQTRL